MRSEEKERIVVNKHSQGLQSQLVVGCGRWGRSCGVFNMYIRGLAGGDVDV